MRNASSSCDRRRQHPFLQEHNERVFKIRNFAVSQIGIWPLARGTHKCYNATINKVSLYTQKEQI